MSNTPQAVPRTASSFLEQADRTLGQRGKQYDVGGKQERSMAKIVAAFNAVHDANGTQLTEQQGWAFMMLLKLVRGAHKPHADSALDAVSYSALYAESVQAAIDAEGKQGSTDTGAGSVDALMKQIRAGYKGCPNCGADVDKEAVSCHNCDHAFEADAGYEHLQAKLRNSEEALRLVRSERDDAVESYKQLMIRKDELHSDVSQAMKELADVRAECAKRTEQNNKLREERAGIATVRELCAARGEELEQQAYHYEQLRQLCTLRGDALRKIYEIAKVGYSSKSVIQILDVSHTALQTEVHHPV